MEEDEKKENNSKVKTVGFIFLALGFILAITALVLCGLHFNFTNMRWTNHGFSSIGAIELTSIILVWLALLIGICAISNNKNAPCLLFFIVVCGLSALFILGIVIFAFIGTQHRFFDEYVGCNANYKGFLKIWNAVDNYLYSVDSLLCSQDCPCYMDDQVASWYSSNSTTAPYFTMWSQGPVKGYAKKFQDCDARVKGLAKAEYYYSNAYFNNTFNPSKFHDYYERIEKYFKCTGFCGLTYFNGKTQTNQKIVKYLFSDLSENGIPEHFGCIPQIVGWLRKTLNAYAALGCFLFVVQIALIIVAVFLLLQIRAERIEQEERQKEEEEEEKNRNKKLVEDEPNNQDEEQKHLKERKEPDNQEEAHDNQEEVHDIQEEQENNEELNNSYQAPKEQIEENDMNFNPSSNK